MFTHLLKAASLVAAGSILAVAMAVAAPARAPVPSTDFSDYMDTTPLKQSARQPVTRAGAGAYMEYPDTEPLAASRAQPITHDKYSDYDTDDRVDLILPKVMNWR